jgi:alpha-L-fucosidase
MIASLLMIAASLQPVLVAPATLLAALPQQGEAPVEYPAIEERMQWFTDARFGMFIHWGPVALTGQEIGWSRGTKTPREKYDNLYKKWNPVNFDADAWAELAAQAGMKYLVLTTKHHDGFCLWDSKLTQYDIMSGPYQRDVVGELAAACEKRGIRFCAYYSVLDWWHPHYTPQNMRFGGPGAQLSGTKPTMDVYVSYMKGQLAELVHRYDPGMIWFDGEWEEPWSKQRGEDLAAFMHELNPSVIINNRVGKGRTAYQDGSNPGDFDTPEQKIGHFQIERPWETCMTVATQWAWKPNDPAKSLRQCVQSLVRCAAGDGNFLFNVGPQADGAIDPFHAQRLQQMGAWMRENGDTIYGTRGGPWETSRWGGATTRGNKIWLHVLEWDGDGLNLPAFGQQITAVQLRQSSTSGGPASLAEVVEWKQLESGALMVSLDERFRQDIDTILELTVAETVNQLAEPGGAMPAFLMQNGGGDWISKDASFRTSSTSPWDRQKDHELLLTPKANNPEYSFHTNLEPNPWVEVDLGAVHRIVGAEIGNRPGFHSRSEGLAMSVSCDGKKWQTIWEAKNQKDHWKFATPSFASARYVRLETVNASDSLQPLHLRSIKIYGRAAEWADETESALSEAGEARAELEKALHHYRNAGDEQELAAVEFLIQNMPGRGYARLGFQTADGVEVPFEALDYPNLKAAEEAFAELETQHGSLAYGKVDGVLDFQTISAEFLVENTDLAFEAWRTKPWAKELSFDAFCEHILPYRCSDEPLDAWRLPLMVKFANLESELSDPKSAGEASGKISGEVHKMVRFWDLYYLHPTDQGYSEMLESGTGRCEDISNMISFANRANAIAVASDYTPAWANRDNNHAWNAVLGPDGRGKAPIHNVAAKVYRKTYAQQKDCWIDKAGPGEQVPRWLARRQYVDVTDQYFDTTDVTVQLTTPAPALSTLAYLCVFNGGEWIAIQGGEVQDGTATFERMGRGILLLPAWFDGEQLIPAAAPITITANGSVHQLDGGSGGGGQAIEITTTKPETGDDDTLRPIPAIHVKAGQQYELLVWDGGWQSMGKKTAGDQPVRFDGLPVNRLYWVIGEQGRRLERPFTLQSGAQRMW